MTKKSVKRLLSFLLTLAMVMGLMPVMSLTAYADTTYKITISYLEGCSVTLNAQPAAVDGEYLNNGKE